jgi:hypothetical protein
MPIGRPAGRGGAAGRRASRPRPPPGRGRGRGRTDRAPRASGAWAEATAGPRQPCRWAGRRCRAAHGEGRCRRPPLAEVGVESVPARCRSPRTPGELRADPVGMSAARRASASGRTSEGSGERPARGGNGWRAGVGKPLASAAEGGHIDGSRPRTRLPRASLTRPPNRRAASISATNHGAERRPGGSRASNLSPVAMGRAMGQALRRAGAAAAGLIPDRGDGCIWGSAQPRRRQRATGWRLAPAFRLSALTRFAAASSNRATGTAGMRRVRLGSARVAGGLRSLRAHAGGVQ